MKTLNLTAILASVALSLSVAAYAEDTVKHNAHSHQLISKRPHHPTIATQVSTKEQQWEGATSVDDKDGKGEKHVKNQKAHRLHKHHHRNLSKRSF